MKSLIASVAIAATLSTGAFASEVCNDIPNPTRFMPTELSAYQECFLTEYRSDEQAGVLGSLAWVRLNGEYYSVQVKEVIRKAGTSTKFGEAFAELISQDVAIDLALDTVAEADDALAEMKITETVVIRELVEVIQRDPSDVAQIAALNDELADLQSQINGLEWESDKLDRIAKAVGTFNSDTMNNEAWATIHAVRALVEAASAPNVDISVTTPSSSQGDVNHAIATSGASAGDVVRVSGVSAPGYSNGYMDVVIMADGSWAVAGVTANPQGGYIGSDDAALYADRIEVSTLVDLGEITDAISAAAQAAYSDGYEDGFRDGYKQGYADGAAGRDPQL